MFGGCGRCVGGVSGLKKKLLLLPWFGFGLFWLLFDVWSSCGGGVGLGRTIDGRVFGLVRESGFCGRERRVGSGGDMVGHKWKYGESVGLLGRAVLGMGCSSVTCGLGLVVGTTFSGLRF